MSLKNSVDRMKSRTKKQNEDDDNDDEEKKIKKTINFSSRQRQALERKPHRREEAEARRE